MNGEVTCDKWTSITVIVTDKLKNKILGKYLVDTFVTPISHVTFTLLRVIFTFMSLLSTVHLPFQPLDFPSHPQDRYNTPHLCFL